MEARAGHRNRDAGPWRSLKVFLGLGLLFMVSYLLMRLKIVVLPMVLAFFISSLLNPMALFFQKKLPRSVSVMLSLAVGMGVIWIAVIFVMSSLATIQEGLPSYKPEFDLAVNEIRDVLSRNLDPLTRHFDFSVLDMLKEQLHKISFGSMVSGIVNQFVVFLGYFLLTLLFTLYFLPALPRFPDRLRRAFPGRGGARLCAAVAVISKKVQGYLLVKCMLSMGLGAWFGFTCLAFGVAFAATWGIIAFLLNFIPTVGIVASVVLPTLMCALQHGWTSSLWLALCLGAPAAVTLNWAEPTLLGRSVDLSPVAALMAILFWGVLWGGTGMIIAVPLTAVIKLTCDSFDDLKPLGKLMGAGTGHGPRTKAQAGHAPPPAEAAGTLEAGHGGGGPEAGET
jgi:predicted PurR-regulated permease PerM